MVTTTYSSKIYSLRLATKRKKNSKKSLNNRGTAFKQKTFQENESNHSSESFTNYWDKLSVNN